MNAEKARNAVAEFGAKIEAYEGIDTITFYYSKQTRWGVAVNGKTGRAGEALDNCFDSLWYLLKGFGFKG